MHAADTQYFRVSRFVVNCWVAVLVYGVHVLMTSVTVDWQVSATSQVCARHGASLSVRSGTSTPVSARPPTSWDTSQCLLLSSSSSLSSSPPSSSSPLYTRLVFSVCTVFFTARRVWIARTMPWQNVCLSVCPSHAGIMCKRLYISSKYFHYR